MARRKKPGLGAAGDEVPGDAAGVAAASARFNPTVRSAREAHPSRGVGVGSGVAAHAPDATATQARRVNRGRAELIPMGISLPRPNAQASAAAFAAGPRLRIGHPPGLRRTGVLTCEPPRTHFT